jgi:hypothetical protein
MGTKLVFPEKGVVEEVRFASEQKAFEGLSVYESKKKLGVDVF